MAFKTPPGMKPSVVKYNCPLQIYDVIEVFSGAEVLSDAVRDLGLAAASLDVVNWASYKAKRAKSGRPLKCRNGLDLCGPAGFGFLDYIERATGLWSSHVLLLLLLLLSLAFHCLCAIALPAICLRLLLSTILRARGPFVVSFGLVCSTFVAVSRGSTCRHYFLPLGNESAPSVKVGNLLCTRTPGE